MTQSIPPQTAIYHLEGPKVFRNLNEEAIRHCIEYDGCLPADNGAVVAYSGKYTGRTPKDKYLVRDDTTKEQVWWGTNNPMPPETFAHVRERIYAYLEDRPTYIVDAFAGADPAYQIKVRFIVERAYHALFVRQLLMRPSAEELIGFEPDWTIVDACHFSMDGAADGVRSDAVIALDMSSKEVLVAGTQYAGELKKSVFTIMNYLLPLQGVMSMHCSANIGKDGDTALFFGLSGTGKTTLSADPERLLIGDDEHGWSPNGVFNVEGGCYAKCINLSRQNEPEIWEAISRGAVLENVVLREGGSPDYTDASLTENTRAAYPLEHIPNAIHPSMGGHAHNIVFLTCDALGVLPPISLLTPDQAMFFFLNGYTAKVAGTETGIKEPVVTFSTCFAQPFLPLNPEVYGDLLHKKISENGSKVWLLNTGWTGGPYGTGSRIDLHYTRAMLTAALSGSLSGASYEADPVFGLNIPASCEGVPPQILNPRNTWEDKQLYDLKARELKSLFEENARKMGYKT